MMMQGGGLGSAAFTSALRLSMSACEQSTWESDKSVRCLVSHEVSGSRHLMTTVGLRAGSATVGLSVDTRSMSSAQWIYWAATGSASVTVVGLNLGLSAYTGAARLSDTSCKRTVWESDTSVQCEAGGWITRSRLAAIGAVQRVGSMSEAFPVDLTRGSHSICRVNAGGSGSNMVTIQGAKMGLAGYSVSGRIGQSWC